MLNGRLEQHGAPRAFFEQPASAAAARFFGATNLVAGILCGHRFDGPFGPVTVAQDGTDGPGLLVVRPETLRLTESGRHVVPVTVTRADYRDTHTAVTVTTGSITLQVSAPAGAEVPVGGRVHIPPHAATVVPPG